jgi:hypothetical protein
MQKPFILIVIKEKSSSYRPAHTSRRPIQQPSYFRSIKPRSPVVDSRGQTIDFRLSATPIPAAGIT